MTTSELAKDTTLAGSDKEEPQPVIGKRAFEDLTDLQNDEFIVSADSNPHGFEI